MSRTVDILRVAIAVLGLAGCQSVPSSGHILAPVRVDAAPAASAPGTASGAGDFDFTKEDRPDEPPATSDAPLTDADLLAGMGIDGAAKPPGTAAPVTPTAPPTPVAAPVAPAAAPIVWPTAPPSSWGVRLVSTVPDAQPPLAILATADGTNIVVQPGALLPDARLIVLAIGRDAVQVGEVVAEGDHARVDTKTITSLYTASPPAPQR